MNPAENAWSSHTADATEAAEATSPTPIPAGRPSTAPLLKNPSLAAFLSLFPGIGNIYNGLYLRGITFFLIIVSAIAVTQKQPLFGLAIAFFWIFNMIDAYRQAVLINYGYAQDLGLLDLPRHPRANQGGVVAGALLTLIGLVALLDQYFSIDFEWLVKMWPVALMVIGVWLVVGSLRDRARDRERQDGV